MMDYLQAERMFLVFSFFYGIFPPNISLYNIFFIYK